MNQDHNNRNTKRSIVTPKLKTIRKFIGTQFHDQKLYPSLQSTICSTQSTEHNDFQNRLEEFLKSFSDIDPKLVIRGLLNYAVSKLPTSIAFGTFRETKCYEISVTIPKSISIPRNTYADQLQYMKEIGRGGFGKVMKAFSEIDQKAYAIKIIRISSKSDKVIKEARVLADLQHDNIVRYHTTWFNFDDVPDSSPSSCSNSPEFTASSSERKCNVDYVSAKQPSVCNSRCKDILCICKQLKMMTIDKIISNESDSIKKSDLLEIKNSEQSSKSHPKNIAAIYNANDFDSGESDNSLSFNISSCQNCLCSDGLHFNKSAVQINDFGEDYEDTDEIYNANDFDSGKSDNSLSFNISSCQNCLCSDGLHFNKSAVQINDFGEDYEDTDEIFMTKEKWLNRRLHTSKMFSSRKNCFCGDDHSNKPAFQINDFSDDYEDTDEISMTKERALNRRLHASKMFSLRKNCFCGDDHSNKPAFQINDFSEDYEDIDEISMTKERGLNRRLHASKMFSTRKNCFCGDDHSNKPAFQINDFSEDYEDTDEISMTKERGLNRRLHASKIEDVKNSPKLLGNKSNSLSLAPFLHIQMELCDSTLREWIDERNDAYYKNEAKGKIDDKENKTIFSQILDAVAYIHSKGIMHRDLKPGNIFFAQNKVKIGDFGLASESETDGMNIYEMTFDIGTSYYISPEMKKSSNYSVKTDIYSLGVILYEMYTPFQTKMETDKSLKSLTESSVGEQILEFPDQLDLVKKMIAHNSDDRPEAKEILKFEMFQEKLSNLNLMVGISINFLFSKI
ncbi:Eukaryotic translation initiation factor 2-alpha kinase 1 [Nymphon striatum]|nr:Eukaryotic translation initiation factor 2-alpha kinase 1 [Nymphon striatum]